MQWDKKILEILKSSRFWTTGMDLKRSVPGELQALTERLASLNERCKQELSHEDALNVHAAFEAANLELDKKMEEQRVYQKENWAVLKMEEQCKAKLLSVIRSTHKGKLPVVARKQGGVWVKCRCKIHAIP